MLLAIASTLMLAAIALGLQGARIERAPERVLIPVRVRNR